MQSINFVFFVLKLKISYITFKNTKQKEFASHEIAEMTVLDRILTLVFDGLPVVAQKYYTLLLH